MVKKDGLIKTTAFLYLLQFLAIALAFLRTAVFANYFGASWQADAYNTALKVPTVLFALVATAIKTVVVPIYSKQLYQRGKAAADSFYSSLLTVTVVIAGVFSILLILFSKQAVYLFAPGLPGETAALASRMTKCFSVVVGMLAILSIQDGVLSVYRKYIYAKLSSELALVVRILFLVAFAGTLGIYAAVAGFLCGTACSLLMSTLGTAKHVKYTPQISLEDNSIQLALRTALPVFIGVGIAEVNRIVDGVLASFMDTGSIASLNYAYTLENSIITLCINLINIVYYPILSKQIAENDIPALCKTYNMVLSIVAYMTCPLVVGGLVLRREIVSIVFFRGAFNENNATIVAALFALYMIGAGFGGIRKTATNVLLGMNDSKSTMINSSLGVLINIVLNIILGYFFGVYGLAIATSCSMITATILMVRTTKRALPMLTLHQFSSALWKAFLSACLMGASVCLLSRIINMNLYVDSAVCVVIGACIYFGLLILFRAQEVMELLGIIGNSRK